MPAQFVTVKKSQPEFSDYLWGRLEHVNNLRAIPVKTYDLGTADESVTFEMKSITEIKRPGLFAFFAAFIKLNSFILILFPLFYVLEKNYYAGGYNTPLGIFFAAVSSIFLFAGLNIRNDVYDHISGFDRVNIDLNRKPIRMGWISAQLASRVSMGLIILAGVLAVPATLLQPKLMWVIAAALVLFFVGRFAKNNSYKQQHSGELILFLLIGPALAVGYQVAAGSVVDVEVIGFGALWGFLVLYLIQVNNFSHIMTSSQSGIKNTMTKLGFDWAQKFLIVTWLVFILLNLLFHFYFSTVYWTVVGTVTMLGVSVPTLLKIADIKSPMGSGLQVIRKDVQRNFLIFVLLSLIEIFWLMWAGKN